jgi:ketosteroid isomerase-like protein
MKRVSLWIGRTAMLRTSSPGWWRPASGTAAGVRARLEAEILPAMGAENVAPVRAFADAITRVDPDAAVALCDPEIEFLSVLAVSGRAYRGHAGIRQYFEDVASAWDEWRVEVHRVTAAPDGRVVIVMTMHVRGRESGAGLAEQTAHVWTVRQGRLLRNEPYREPAEALRAVGLAP